MINEAQIFFKRTYGSQIRAASAIGIRNDKLSILIHGHVHPNEREKAKLISALGVYRYRKFFGGKSKVDDEAPLN